MLRKLYELPLVIQIIMSILESHEIIFSTHNGNQNLHTRDLIENTGTFDP
jgi:hypothetical protein